MQSGEGIGMEANRERSTKKKMIRQRFGNGNGQSRRRAGGRMRGSGKKGRRKLRKDRVGKAGRKLGALRMQCRKLAVHQENRLSLAATCSLPA
eukprot:6176500-Pleurochrysis_carterae.AAC.1